MSLSDNNMDWTLDQAFDQIKLQTDFFEKAKLINYLNKEKQIPLKQISETVQVKSSYLCHILRLQKLPELVIDGYYSKLISISHLFIISRLKTDEEMIQAYEKVLSNGLTVADTENLIRELLYEVKNEGELIPKDQVNEFTKALENKEIKAKVIQTRSRTKLTLEIKGSPAKTSPILMTLLKIIKSWIGGGDF